MFLNSRFKTYLIHEPRHDARIGAATAYSVYIAAAKPKSTDAQVAALRRDLGIYLKLDAPALQAWASHTTQRKLLLADMSAYADSGTAGTSAAHFTAHAACLAYGGLESLAMYMRALAHSNPLECPELACFELAHVASPRHLVETMQVDPKNAPVTAYILSLAARGDVWATPDYDDAPSRAYVLGQLLPAYVVFARGSGWMTGRLDTMRNIYAACQATAEPSNARSQFEELYHNAAARLVEPDVRYYKADAVADLFVKCAAATTGVRVTQARLEFDANLNTVAAAQALLCIRASSRGENRCAIALVAPTIGGALHAAATGGVLGEPPIGANVSFEATASTTSRRERELSEEEDIFRPRASKRRRIVVSPSATPPPARAATSSVAPAREPLFFSCSPSPDLEATGSPAPHFAGDRSEARAIPSMQLLQWLHVPGAPRP